MPLLTLKEDDRGRAFTVDQDGSIEVRLRANPTTGYVWALDEVDDSVLAVHGYEFLLPEDPQFGEGGAQVFSFTATAAGVSVIRLKHWREWEGIGSIIDWFEVTITVRE